MEKNYLEKVKKSENKEANKLLKVIQDKLEFFELNAKEELAKQYKQIYQMDTINVNRMRKVKIEKAKILSLRNAALTNKVDFEETKQDAIKALTKRGVKIMLDPVIQANNLKIDFGHREFLIRELKKLKIDSVGERYTEEINIDEELENISITTLINYILSAEKTPVRNKDAMYEDFLKDIDSVNIYIKMQETMKDI